MTALLRVIAGLVGWAIGFSLLYAVHGIACARSWSAIAIGPLDLQRVVLIAAWVAPSAALGFWTWAQFRAPPYGDMPLISWLARASALTGLLSMVVTGLPVATVRQCNTPAAATELKLQDAMEREYGVRGTRPASICSTAIDMAMFG